MLMNITPKQDAPARPSVSVLLLSLNEEKNIRDTTELVLENLKSSKITDFEIIFVDASSTDGTPQIIGEYLARDPEHFKKAPDCRGLGIQFRTGVKHATKEFVGWFPTDNETLPETIKNILDGLGKADVVIPYTANPWARTSARRAISALYVQIVNLLFGLRLRYYNGTCFFRRELLSSVEMTTDGPAYMTEILVQLVKRPGISYVEVPMFIRFVATRPGNVLTWKNVVRIGKTFASLFWRVHFKSTPTKLTTEVSK